MAANPFNPSSIFRTTFSRLPLQILGVPLAVLLGSSMVVAQTQTREVSIVGVTPSGGLTHGAPVTLTSRSGAGFGAFGGAVLSWDDFESAAAGADINNLQPVRGFTWKAFRGSPATDTIAITGNRYHSGSRSVFLSWDAETINAFGWGFGGDPKKGPYSRLYISYWRYYTGNYVQGQHNHKAFYVYGSGAQDLPQAISFIPAADTRWGVMSNQALGANYSDNTNPTDVTFDSAKDAWHRWDYWFVLNTTGIFDGVIWHQFDQTLKINRSNFKFRSDTQYGQWNSLAIGHMGQGMLGQLRQWYDDVYIATTRARVELCSGSSWSNRGRCEIQPPESWTDGSITVSLNRGGFASSTAYLYVIDADGNVSNPFAVSVSSVGGAAPSPPTAVRVIR